MPSRLLKQMPVPLRKGGQKKIPGKPGRRRVSNPASRKQLRKAKRKARLLPFYMQVVSANKKTKKVDHALFAKHDISNNTLLPALGFRGRVLPVGSSQASGSHTALVRVNNRLSWVECKGCDIRGGWGAWMNSSPPESEGDEKRLPNVRPAFDARGCCQTTRRIAQDAELWASYGAQKRKINEL